MRASADRFQASLSANGKKQLRITRRLRSRGMSETAKPAASQPLVEIAILVEFIARALAAAGIPPEDAEPGGRSYGRIRRARRGRARRVPIAAVREADSERRRQSPAQHTGREQQGRLCSTGRRQRAGSSGHETRRGTGDRKSARSAASAGLARAAAIMRAPRSFIREWPRRGT